MSDRIRSLLERISGAKVLCLGDLMLDRYVYGEATRLSPEAPVPIVTVRRQTLIPGGSGNVVMNLSSIGANPWAVGLAGDDRPAEELSELLQGALDPLSPPLIRDPSRPTTIKTRVIAGIQQIVRFDEEYVSPLSANAERIYQEVAALCLPQAAAVIVSDYGKGTVSASLLSWLMPLAKEMGLPVVIDPKGDDYGRYRGATLVTPNRQELALAVGRDIARGSQEVLIAAGFALMARHGLENLLITRSEEGMTLLGSNHFMRHFPARAKDGSGPRGRPCHRRGGGAGHRRGRSGRWQGRHRHGHAKRDSILLAGLSNAESPEEVAGSPMVFRHSPPSLQKQRIFQDCTICWDRSRPCGGNRSEKRPLARGRQDGATKAGPPGKSPLGRRGLFATPPRRPIRAMAPAISIRFEQNAGNHEKKKKGLRAPLGVLRPFSHRSSRKRDVAGVKSNRQDKFN